jgi:hypothetical protein
MIEFSQPAQCLFCPQRRKIALLMKLVLAGSAAIITAIVLFQPGNTRVPAPRTAPLFQGGATNNPGIQPRAEGQPIQRLGASDAVLKRGAGIRTEAQARFKEVQSQIRPLVKEELPPFAKAQRLLNELGREVLKTKVLTLGEELFFRGALWSFVQGLVARFGGAPRARGELADHVEAFRMPQLLDGALA